MKPDLEDKCDFLIVNAWWGFNYGAALTAWALQKIIEDNGFSSKLVDNRPAFYKKNFKGSISENFAQEFLNIAQTYSFSQLQEKCSTRDIGLITGSDQVFRPAYTYTRNPEIYFLNFASLRTRKIALSASFGINKNEFLNDKGMTKPYFKYMDRALHSFDYLSTREFSGKEILKEIFHLNSDFMMDSVFIIDKDRYSVIINKSEIMPVKRVSYILDKDEKYSEFLEENEFFEVTKDLQIKDWLKIYSECEFVITDSFHGTCFAIIFNKPFICVMNKSRGAARFESLRQLFNLRDNFVESIDDIYKIDLNNITPDWDYINSILRKESKRCSEIITKVLKENYTNNKNIIWRKIANRFYFTRISFMKNLKKLSCFLGSYFV